MKTYPNNCNSLKALFTIIFITIAFGEAIGQINIGENFKIHELSINPKKNTIITSSFNSENEKIGIEVYNLSTGHLIKSFGFGNYHPSGSELHNSKNLVAYCDNYTKIIGVDVDGLSGKRRIDVYDSETFKKINTINLITTSGEVASGFTGQIDFREHFVFIAYYNAIFRINILTSKVETISVFEDQTKSYSYEGFETFNDNEFVVSARTDEGFELEYIKIIDLDKGSYNSNTLTLPNNGYNHISISTSELNCFISTVNENVTKTDNTAGNEEKMQFDDKIYGSYYTNGREFYYSWYSKDVHVKSSTFDGKITLYINPYKLIVLEDVIYCHDIRGNLYMKNLLESNIESPEKVETTSFKEKIIIKEDEFPEYYDNGQVRKVGPKENGVPNGYWRFYYDDGSLQAEGNVSDGLYDGLIKVYYRTGVLGEVSNYGAGEYHGEYTFYHPNGKIKVKGHYKNGKKDGLWEYWNEDGSFREKRELNNSTYKVNTKKYSDDGVKCSRCNLGQYWGGFCTMCGAASPARLKEH